jgi:hypothetical protein
MTPQAFSYPTVGPDDIIYCPPYGLKESLDYMISINPQTYEVKKISVSTNNSTEKWTFGIVVNALIYWIPYGEESILVYNTENKSVSHIQLDWPGDTKHRKGKFVQGHIYNNKIYALPYGEDESLDLVLIIDLDTNTAILKELPMLLDNDAKKWHQSILRDNVIYAAPRGANKPFNFAVEYNCDDYSVNYVDFSKFYNGFENTRMKFTTIGMLDNVIYAMPYGYHDDFNFLMINKDGEWSCKRLNMLGTTRKYFTNLKTKNNKIYCPPAGHHPDWCNFLIINNNEYKIIDLKILSETKKYFTGIENSQGKVYYIPRGGCICDPDASLKLTGDLAEVLIVDTKDDSFYTVDVSECFTDNTTIEKYNACCIINDVLYAMPYGESDTFQTVLVFDTIQDKIIKRIDLNDIHIF